MDCEHELISAILFDMMNFVARRKLKKLYSEAKRSGWSDEADLIERAVYSVSENGSLAGWRWSYALGRVRSDVVDVSSCLVDWRKELEWLELAFGKHSNIRSVRSFDDARRVASELRERTRIAWRVRRPCEVLSFISHESSTVFKSAKNIPDRETLETQFEESKRRIHAGHQKSFDLLTKMIDIADRDMSTTSRHVEARSENKSQLTMRS